MRIVHDSKEYLTGTADLVKQRDVDGIPVTSTQVRELRQRLSADMKPLLLDLVSAASMPDQQGFTRFLDSMFAHDIWNDGKPHDVIIQAIEQRFAGATAHGYQTGQSQRWMGAILPSEAAAQ